MKKWNWRRGLLGAGAVLVTLAASLQGAPAYADEGRNVVLPSEGFTWEEGKTVYYKDETPKPEGDKDYTKQYPSLDAALAAVYISDPGAETAVLYCKPGANVKAQGVDTRVHVADNVTIYGNGAYMPASSDFASIEIDHRAYKRAESAFGFNQFWFWNADESKSDLTKDITLTVKSLDGVGLWGERKTTYTINAVFEDCQNMYGILQHTSYSKPFGEQNGTTNVTVKDSSFDANNGSYKDWSIQLQNGGSINVENTTFDGVKCPIDLNNKSVEGSKLNLKDCTFTDCATKGSGYGSPISIDGKKGSATDVKIDGVDFVYSEGVEPGSDNAIQIGGLFSYPDVTLDVSNIDANIKVNGDGVNKVIDVDKTDKVTGGNSEEEPPVVICVYADHGKKVVPEAPATCTEDGTEAYWTCDACGKMYADAELKNEIDEPVTIKATGHSSEKWVANSTEHWKECDSCGADFDVEGHSFGEWEVTEEPTAGAAGSKERACATCGRVETAEVPRLDAPAEPSGPSGEPSDEPSGPSGEPSDKPSGKPADRGDGPAALPQTGDAAVLAQLAAAGSGAAAIAAGAIAARKRR